MGGDSGSNSWDYSEELDISFQGWRIADISGGDTGNLLKEIGSRIGWKVNVFLLLWNLEVKYVTLGHYHISSHDDFNILLWMRRAKGGVYRKWDIGGSEMRKGTEGDVGDSRY